VGAKKSSYIRQYIQVGATHSQLKFLIIAKHKGPATSHQHPLQFDWSIEYGGYSYLAKVSCYTRTQKGPATSHQPPLQYDWSISKCALQLFS
jgi:hypothetical protein